MPTIYLYSKKRKKKCRGSVWKRSANILNISTFRNACKSTAISQRIWRCKSPEVQFFGALAEGEGFGPPDACTSTVFKFYFLFVVFRLLLLFNRPNYRKISVLTALLSDNPGFLLCFGIVSRSLSFLIFSAFLTAFCRDFVDDKIIMLI